MMNEGPPEDPYAPLDQLIPLSVEELAAGLEVDQLEAVLLLTDERIAQLSPAPAAEPSNVSFAVAAAAAATAITTRPPTTTSSTTTSRQPKSRWDSSSSSSMSEDDILNKKKKKRKSAQAQPTVLTSISSDGYYDDKIGTREVSQYLIKAHIGQGTFGSVMQAFDQIRGLDVALKHLALTSDTGYPPSLLTELELLCTLRHPNLVRLYDLVFGPLSPGRIRKVYLSMELFDMDLHEFMERFDLDRAEIWHIAKSLLRGVCCLHENGFVHRDIKPANIFLQPRGGRVALGDFGSAAKHDACMTPQITTLYYRAPEMLLGLAYTEAVDVWSCGCVVAQLLGHGHVCFAAPNEVGQLRCIVRALGSSSWPPLNELGLNEVERDASWCPTTDPLELDLLLQCLTLDPASRASSASLLKHPLVSESLRS